MFSGHCREGVSASDLPEIADSLGRDPTRSLEIFLPILVTSARVRRRMWHWGWIQGRPECLHTAFWQLKGAVAWTTTYVWGDAQAPDCTDFLRKEIDSLNAENPTECFARMIHRATFKI